MIEAGKFTVSMKALIQRINRKLGADEKLRKSRSRAAKSDVGDFYIIDINRNVLMSTHVDPEELGRELGVLHQSETVVEEETP